MLYDQLRWLWSPFPTIVPWVHSPPSSHWTTTVDPMGIDTKTCEASLFLSFLLCLCISWTWCLSSLSTITDFLSITGITPHTWWLNSNVARLGRPCTSGVVWICHNAMWMSPPASKHFLWCTWWIWCMLWLVHCSGGDMMMTPLAQCWDCCRNFWISLKQNWCQCLTLTYTVYCVLQIWPLLLQLDSLLITPPSFLLLGICCGNLRYINIFVIEVEYVHT